MMEGSVRGDPEVALQEIVRTLAEVDAETKGQFAAEVAGFRAEADSLLSELEPNVAPLQARVDRWLDRIGAVKRPGARAPRTLTCPLCGAQLTALVERCPSCSGDLKPLLSATALADRYFNHAVVAGREKRWALAAESLTVALAVRPDDVGAWVLLGKIRFGQGQREAACCAWREALRLSPECDNAKLALAKVEAALARRPAEASATRRKRKHRNRRAR